MNANHDPGNHAAEEDLPSIPRGRIVLALAAVLAAGIFAYANGLDGPFVLDDLASIVHNETLRRGWAAPFVGPENPRGSTYEYRPLLTASLAANYAASGLAVRPYHVTNLVLHLVAATTLFLLVLGTLRLPRIPTATRRAALGLATAVTGLWVVHPLTTSAVTYTIQRGECLVVICYLGLIACVMRGGRDGASPRWSITAVAVCALGMAAKEVMVAAPIVALLYDRTFLAGDFRTALRRRPRMYVGLALTWIILATLVILAQGRGGSVQAGGPIGVGTYLATQPVYLARYLSLVVWPTRLVFDYGTWTVSSPGEALPAILLALALIALALWALVKRPRWGFAGALVFAVLAPSSTFIPVQTQTGAEHRMYLPLAALLALIVVGAHALLASRGRGVVRVLGGAVFAAVVALALVTRDRNVDYSSAEALWTNTVERWPQGVRGHHNLGVLLAQRGDFAAALEQFDRALESEPRRLESLINRASSLRALGRVEEAIRTYDRAIEIDPTIASHLAARGDARMQARDLEGATADFEAAIVRDPENALWRYLLATARLQRRQLDLAVEPLERALRLRGDYAEACEKLVLLHVELGRPERANAVLAAYRRAGGRLTPTLARIVKKPTPR
ncbi:MAG: tetratricopeptide repeat protein [Planctomycetota bacterium]